MSWGKFIATAGLFGAYYSFFQKLGIGLDNYKGKESLSRVVVVQYPIHYCKAIRTQEFI